MTYITDTQVEQSCAILKKAIEAAENSNHAGEVFVVAAANATALVEALESIARESTGEDGCYYTNRRNIQRARTALTLAKGGRA